MAHKRENKFFAQAMKWYLSIFVGILLCAHAYNPARADNWRASLYEEGAPRHLVGVDKKRHTFNFFEKKSPLRLRYSYPCVTGQLPGDKRQINDLRTPEGVYFVEYKIANGLDFREYGGIAYTLNYPNPVDRLRGKTGHGIWIHSKGFELVPTRGCVAIDLRNIAEVGPLLTPGTPVVVAEELNGSPGGDNRTLATLRKLMADWSTAWAARSTAMFDFYDPVAYTRATENFDAFRQNKERLFKILTFIKIYNREIHALEGPGYWVTWSEQFYTASNLSTEGVRRLYWQKDDSGRFRIVGMEWTPRDLGMRAEFLKGRLVAEVPTFTASDASSEAPLAPRLDMPEQPGELEKPAPQKTPVVAAAKPPLERPGGGLTETISALSGSLMAISDPLVPRRQPRVEAPDEINWGTGKRITETPDKPAAPVRDTPQINLPARQKPLLQPTVETPPAPAQKPAPAKIAPVQAPVELTLDEPTLADLRASMDAWLNAYAQRDASIADLYDPKDYNRLPAQFGVPRASSYQTVMREINRDLAQPWLKIISRDAKFDSKGPIAHAEIEQMLIGPGGRRQGVREIWWRKGGDGKFRIVGSTFKPAELGLDANYLEQVSGSISAMLEDWRSAWEKGILDDYMSHYTTDAVQQGRMGNASIRRQKEQLWSRVRPASVHLSGMRYTPDPKGIRVDMTQAYSDSSGRADKGVKTLLLRYDGQNWLIQREDWLDQRQQATLKLP